VSFYQDSDQFYQVMEALFQRLAADPQAAASFGHNKMVVRLRCTDPPAEIVLDGRNNPVQASFGPQPVQADLDLLMTADLLHNIWLGQVRLRDAFMSGQIKVAGNVFRAMRLADLFREAEATYPLVLRDLGYEV
jgi:alkyl sulfatase BDS1-like metallo-beta-lactamase superfamily hydrolase